MREQSVLQTWVCWLSFMQQSVLITAMRGPDGVEKDHVSKLLVRWLRRCVVHSAFESQMQGKPAVFTTPYEQGGGSFTGPSVPDEGLQEWEVQMDRVLERYLATLDGVPHHFQLHFMHAAEILGYEHEDNVIRSWWFEAYRRLANDMHLNVETLAQMEAPSATCLVCLSSDVRFKLDGCQNEWHSIRDGPQNRVSRDNVCDVAREALRELHGGGAF